MLKKKFVLILSLIVAAALLVSACSVESQSDEMDNTEDLMVDEDSNTGSKVEMEDNDDSVDSADGSDDGSADDMGDAEQGEMTDGEDMSQESTGAEMTDEEMMAFIEVKLDGHHDIDRVLNANHDRAGWEETLDRMIGYGADINEEEKALIIDWLLSR